MMIFDYIARGFQLLFDVILPLVSIGAAIFFYRMWRRQSSIARATLGWPSSSGRIQEAGIAEKDGSDSTMYQAEVAYEYQVSGATYTGHRINLHPFSCSDRRVAERTLQRFPVGSEHPVYYDPKHPESSLLQPGLTWWGRLPLIASICLLLSAIVGILFSRYFNEQISRMREPQNLEPRSPATETGQP